MHRQVIAFCFAAVGALMSAGGAGAAVAASAGTVQLSASSYAVAQTTGSLTITIGRSGGSSGTLHAYYGTYHGSALDTVDYGNTYGSLIWGDGDAEPRTIVIPINKANPFAGTKELTFHVLSSTPGVVGSPSQATVTITGDLSASALVLSSSSYTVPANAAALTVSVNRIGSAQGAVTVNHSTSSGTAVAGTNYVPVAGTLKWSDGDASPKTFTVPIGNKQFAGSKTFAVVLSSPTGPAAVSDPKSANVIINGSNAVATGGGGAPSAPANLVMMGQSATGISLAWSAAAPGSAPIAHYKIYRNGSSYVTTAATAYTDYGAVDATNPLFNAEAAIYSYTVSAVDTQGKEGPPTTQTTFNVFANGVFNWQGDYSYSAHPNYRDTAGDPESGAYDIAVSVTGRYGGFQPYSGGVVPQWDLEAGSFGYFSIDLKPTLNHQVWRLSMISRLPPGDVYPWAAVDLTDYGPTPVPGKWATYKVPLSALSIGKTSFEGSISGTTLTVTGVNSGVGVDAGGFITGNGVAPGTYVLGHNANGGPGTYKIYPSQYVSSTNMTEQRTSVFKFDIADQTGASSNHYYVDNVKFTSN